MDTDIRIVITSVYIDREKMSLVRSRCNGCLNQGAFLLRSISTLRISDGRESFSYLCTSSWV